MPEARAELQFEKKFQPWEVTRLKNGLIPHEMEDKWFIFFEDNYLYFHRSWTGIEIFRIELAMAADGSATVKQCWVNRDKDQYNSHNEESELHTIRLLFEQLLTQR
ncbi:MAG: hypothetical protein R3D00_19760 [Bacteroidia bacterium]